MEDKKAMRRMAREAEKNAGGEYLRESDAAAAESFLRLPEFLSARTVFCYLGIGTEPDTKHLIRRMLEMGKTVALPKITGDGTMDARVILGLGELVPGTFGIPEPSDDTEILPPEETDIVIVPAAAFSKDGYRLGRGGGYYDRYLASCDAFSVGLTREKLLLDSAPTEEHDMPVNCIITEKRTARLR